MRKESVAFWISSILNPQDSHAVRDVTLGRQELKMTTEHKGQACFLCEGDPTAGMNKRKSASGGWNAYDVF